MKPMTTFSTAFLLVLLSTSANAMKLSEFTDAITSPDKARQAKAYGLIKGYIKGFAMYDEQIVSSGGKALFCLKDHQKQKLPSRSTGAIQYMFEYQLSRKPAQYKKEDPEMIELMFEAMTNYYRCEN